MVLKRDEAQELLSGDTISLLPNNLCFKVVCEGRMSNNGLNTEEVAGSATENAPSVVFDYHEKSSTSTEVPTGNYGVEIAFSSWYACTEHMYMFA